jgi:hypothetical protein
MSRKTGEIMAIDAQGNRHKILKYTDFETVDTFGASEEVAGYDEYRLVTGEAVNKISDDEFFVVVSNVALKRTNTVL